MEAGQSNKPKVLFIIQARMKSTRLPGKILMPIPLSGGQPLLSWIVNALKKSKWNHEIVLATSKNPENDILTQFADESEIACYRGEEDDVLSRFIEISKLFKGDVVVRLTADNPFIDIDLIDETIDLHLKEKSEYTITNGYPIGMNVEVIHPESIVNLETRELTIADKEHVTLFIRNNSNKQSVLKHVSQEFKNIRLTIDYPSDFVLASSILSFFTSDEKIDLQKIISIREKFPWLFTINEENIQKRQFDNIQEELLEARKILKQYEFTRILKLLENA